LHARRGGVALAEEATLPRASDRASHRRPLPRRRAPDTAFRRRRRGTTHLPSAADRGGWVWDRGVGCFDGYGYTH